MLAPRPCSPPGYLLVPPSPLAASWALALLSRVTDRPSSGCLRTAAVLTTTVRLATPPAAGLVTGDHHHHRVWVLPHDSRPLKARPAPTEAFFRDCSRLVSEFCPCPCPCCRPLGGKFLPPGLLLTTECCLPPRTHTSLRLYLLRSVDLLLGLCFFFGGLARSTTQPPHSERVRLLHSSLLCIPPWAPGVGSRIRGERSLVQPPGGVADSHTLTLKQPLPRASASVTPPPRYYTEPRERGGVDGE